MGGAGREYCTAELLGVGWKHQRPSLRDLILFHFGITFLSTSDTPLLWNWESSCDLLLPRGKGQQLCRGSQRGGPVGDLAKKYIIHFLVKIRLSALLCPSG